MAEDGESSYGGGGWGGTFRKAMGTGTGGLRWDRGRCRKQGRVGKQSRGHRSE